MNFQVEVNNTVASVTVRPSGVLIVSRNGQNTSRRVGRLERINLRIGYMYRIPTFVRRMETNNILNDRVAAYEGRDRIVEDRIGVVLIGLVDERTSETHIYRLYLERVVLYGEMQGRNNARRIVPSGR